MAANNKLIKIGSRYRITIQSGSLKFKDAQAVVNFINKQENKPDGLECLPEFYRAQIK